MFIAYGRGASGAVSSGGIEVEKYQFSLIPPLENRARPLVGLNL